MLIAVLPTAWSLSRARSVMITLVIGSVGMLPNGAVGQTLDPQIESLVVRTQHGDGAARNELGSYARGLATEAAERRLDAESARRTARVTLAMAMPLSPPDGAITPRELEWRGGAVRALRRALAADSGDVWSAVQLEALTPYPYIWYGAPQELEQLRALAARRRDMPAPLALTRLRLELENGTPDSAAAGLARLPANTVSAAGMDHLTAEIAFAYGRDSAAAEAYYHGASMIIDSVDDDWYTRDLMWVATHDELLAWNRLPFHTNARRSWLEAFWIRKDLQNGRLPGTRLSEQFRRWRISLRDYRWDHDGSTSLGIVLQPGAGKVAMIGDAEDVTGLWAMNRSYPLTRVLDDRGGLILRHGEPADKVCGACVASMSAVETWAWITPSGPLVVGFSYAETSRYGMITRNTPQGDLMTLCRLDRRLCLIEPKLKVDPGNRFAAANLTRHIRQDFTHMREVAERTDENAETFHDSLGAIIQAYGIPNGGALVVVAVPANGLVANMKTLDTARTFALHLRAIVGDSAAGRIVGTLDTLRMWNTPSLFAKESFLTGYFTVGAPVGDWTIAVVLGDTAHRAGSGLRFTGVPVPRFDGRTLSLGDPILGRDGGLTWQHEGVAIPLNPTNAWRRDEAAILTYELDGLVAGRRYATTVELWNAGENRKTPNLSITFRMDASQSRELLQRNLGLRQLTPGSYRLVLRVRDMTSGAEVTRVRMLAIRR